jgi:hypothetical protein
MTWETGSQIDPATGQAVTAWTQNLGLNGPQQQSLDSQQQLQQQRSGLAGGLYDRLAQDYQNPVDWSQYQDFGQTPTPGQFDSSQRYQQDAEDAIYGQFERRMEPKFAQQSAATDTALRNQGLRPGTEAYDYAKSQMEQSQNDARQGAQYQATIGSGQEAQRMLGMDQAAQGQTYQQGMMSSNYQNQLRQQQIAEEAQRRGMTLNEMNAILTGQQVQTPQMPSFTNSGRADTTNYSGAAQSQGQADLDAFNAEQQALQGMMSGVTGLVRPGP